MSFDMTFYQIHVFSNIIIELIFRSSNFAIELIYRPVYRVKRFDESFFVIFLEENVQFH